MKNQIELSCQSCQDYHQSLLSILSSVESMLHDATKDFENHDMQYYRGRVDALQAVLNLLREETPGVFAPVKGEPDLIDLSDAIEPQDRPLDKISSKLDVMIGAFAMLHITAAGAAA
jgi:hypothetical protein